MMALARCERCQIDMRRATGDRKQKEQAELCRTGASIHWLLGDCSVSRLQLGAAGADGGMNIDTGRRQKGQ